MIVVGYAQHHRADDAAVVVFVDVEAVIEVGLIEWAVGNQARREHLHPHVSRAALVDLDAVRAILLCEGVLDRDNQVAVAPLVHPQPVAIGRGISVVDEPAVDHRHVNRGSRTVRVGLNTIRRRRIFLIVHQHAVSEVVHDIDVDKRNFDRLGRRGRNLHHNPLGQRVAHLQARHRQTAAPARDERRISARLRTVQRGAIPDNGEILISRKFDLLRQKDRRNLSEKQHTADRRIIVRQENGTSKRARTGVLGIDDKHCVRRTPRRPSPSRSTKRKRA